MESVRLFLMPTRNRFAIFACLLAVSLSAVPAIAQQSVNGDSQPRIDKQLGEEEEILLRYEWFYSTRLAGTDSTLDLWSLRRQAVDDTRRAVAEQKLRRDAGFEGTQNSWVSKGPSPSTFGNWAFGNVSGRIQAIAADFAGGVLYVGGGSGGVWKSTNDGLSWTSIFDTAGTTAVGAIAVDPNNPQVLWVGTGDNVSSCESYFGIGLLRSTDGGVTWEPRNGSGVSTLGDLASFANVIVDARDSNHIVTGGRIRGCDDGSAQNGGIFTTNDGGLTWTERLSGREIDEIRQDPSVLDIYWAGTDAGVYKSIDNGVTWQLQTGNGLPSGSTGRTEIAISPSNPNVVYALFSVGPALWRTTDGGATWSQRASGSSACDGQCWYNMTLGVHNTDSDIVYRGNLHVFKSLNGGTSWTDLSNNWGSSQKVHQDMHAMLMDPANPDAVYVSGDGGIWKTEDGGSTFSNLNGNLNVTQFYAIGVDAADPERICGGAQDNSSLARDTSNVWDRQAVTGDGFVCLIDPQSPNYAYITSYPSGGYPNVWRSSSGLFGSFVDVTGSGSGINSNDRINWVTPYLLDPQSPNILYLGTHRVYRSDNRGSSWMLVSPDLTAGSSSLLTLEINRNYPTHVYSGSVSGRVWRTSNSGTDWTDITTGLPSRSINDVGADPTNPDRAFAVVGGFNSSHLWEWNLGAGWTERGAGLPNVPANSVLMLSDTLLLVGNDVGVFLSFDGGQNFTPFMDGLPEGLVVTDLEFNPLQNIITAGTYGRGVWQISIDPVQPILLVDSVEQPPVEIDGDGDTNIEPGETWSVRPILRNAGGQPALSVSARLSTPAAGVTFLEQAGGYGDINPGEAVAVTGAYVFLVDPSYTCGDDIVFDLVDISTANEPFSYNDRPGAFSTVVIDANDTPIVTTLLDEDFDPSPPGWTHQAVEADIPSCPAGLVHPDDWQIATKDAAHGPSYHAGNGPGGSYSRTSHSWLYPVGRDSTSGPGLVIPADAIAATLTVEHWYDAVAGEDGGKVVLDFMEDGQDVYTSISPVGGYPGSLSTGACNGLEGESAFTGVSGGWVTSMFDLTAYKGLRIYPAFVFGADKSTAVAEGWYIDDIKLEYQQDGPPVCQVSLWPGAVANALFELVAADTIEATWGDSCNAATFPGQTFSIQVGDLDQLAAGGGVYTHAPLVDQCDRLSGATFAPGAGSEYYLIVPAGDGREGSAGLDSAGSPRPQVSAVCGVQRIDCQ